MSKKIDDKRLAKNIEVIARQLKVDVTLLVNEELARQEQRRNAFLLKQDLDNIRAQREAKRVSQKKTRSYSKRGRVNDLHHKWESNRGAKK